MNPYGRYSQFEHHGSTFGIKKFVQTTGESVIIITYISHLAYIEYINLAMNTISNMNNKINLNEVQSRFS